MTTQSIIEEYPLNALGFRELPVEVTTAMALARIAKADEDERVRLMVNFEEAFSRGLIPTAEWNAIRYFNLAIA